MGSWWSARPTGPFPVINDTQAKEDAFDLAKARKLDKPSSVLATVAYIVKGALGAGILGSHAGFSNAGLVAIPVTILIAIYMTFCLNLLVLTAQVIYKRTQITTMSYSEVGEAAFRTSSNRCIQKCAKPFRYFVDIVIIIDLFGTCCCYQLMICGTIKQVVENTQQTSLHGLPGYPSLRMYLLMMAVPMILICLIRQLDLLAKISIFGNFLVVLCIIATIYYSLKVNPNMTGMQTFTSIRGLFTFTGMTVFSMSCAGIVISVENNMKQPHKFTRALNIGMAFVCMCLITLAFFGYSAYGEGSKAPITFHFPMTTVPIMLKIGIALMLVITHAVNFWVPFNLCFHYFKKCHNPKRRHLCWKYFYRALCCAFCTCVGIIFPNVNKLMNFLGAFCLSNEAFIWPAVIWLFVFWHRPGLGKGNWRLLLSLFVIFIGLILFSAGTYVSIGDLIKLFTTHETSEYIDLFM